MGEDRPYKAEFPSEVAIFSRLSSDTALLQAMTVISEIVGTKILTIKDDKQEALYTKMLVQAKTILDGVEGQRKEYVAPLNRCVKSVNDWVKRTFTGPIADKRRELNNALLQYRMKKEEAARAEQKRLDALKDKMQAAAEAKGLDFTVPDLIAAPVENIVRSEGGGQVQVRKQFYLEVVDFKALVDAASASEIPLECVTENQVVLRNLAKGGLEIPGVKYGYREALTVRGAA